MKKIIISQRVEVIENINERRDTLSQEWSAFALECGFLPIILPNNVKLASKMVDSVSPDGIILSGGNDLVSYGGDSPERDDTERFLIKYAVENRLPILGVCRGMQMLLDYFGTKLHKVDGHVRTMHILDNGHEVNSFHSRAAKECSEQIKVTARSEDGYAEEFVHKYYENVCGIMWHPERYIPFRKEDIDWIVRFFKI